MVHGGALQAVNVRTQEATEVLALLFGCWEEELARVVHGGALQAVNVRTHEAT